MGETLDVLEAARQGDERAFGSLVDPHRGELHAHCYRMLGSLHDADDALQDTMLRAWRGLGGFKGDQPIRPWLYRIATNASLDIIGKRPKRVMPFDIVPASDPTGDPGVPLTEVPWLEPYPDHLVEQREGVELAFIAALQHLPARQRAVLILREVLSYSAREVAGLLDTTVASVNSARQRARKTLDERLPDRSQQEMLRDLGDDGVREVVERYVRAWESRDVDLMVGMLVDDALFSMPPHPVWVRGAGNVMAFLTAAETPPLRSVVTSANGQPAIGWYIQWKPGETYKPAAIEVLTLEGDRIKEITAFASEEWFEPFGLPAELS